jgi:hypothetical protein
MFTNPNVNISGNAVKCKIGHFYIGDRYSVTVCAVPSDCQETVMKMRLIGEL